MKVSNLLPPGQRLERFIDHAASCDNCGTIPTDADDPSRTGSLCPMGGVLFADLASHHQHALAVLSTGHQLNGAELASRGGELPEPPAGGLKVIE